MGLVLVWAEIPDGVRAPASLCATPLGRKAGSVGRFSRIGAIAAEDRRGEGPLQALGPNDPRQVGKYRLLHRLGAGGMGRVYLGISPGRRLVAVKVIHAVFEEHPEFLARFRREVLANRLVTGAFTAPVVDHDAYASPPWLVTSYVPGPSLRGAVRDSGLLPESTVVLLAGALAEALASIHEAGLVHRDLKPSNVLLAEDGPRVIDFGIARIEDLTGLTRTKQPMGTYGYIAPEFLTRGESTAASDMFALGGVLVYAATGSDPFGSGSDHLLAYRTVHEQPRLEGIANTELLGLITDCMAQRPDERPTPQQVLERTGFNEHRSTLLDASAWAPAAERTVALRDQANHLADLSTLSAPDDGGRKSSEPGRGRLLSRRSALLAGGAALAGAGGMALLRPWDDSGTSPDNKRTKPSPKPSVSASPFLSGLGPVAYWPLNGDSKRRTRDRAGHHDATARNVEWKDGDAYFDGLHSYLETDRPVVRAGPGKELTVAAWVNLELLSMDGPTMKEREGKAGGSPLVYTAVSQRVPDWDDEGKGACSFYLQYFGGEDSVWSFSVSGLPGDGNGPPQNRVYSDAKVENPHGWTHLAGVQHTDGTVQLYLDGKRQRREAKPTIYSVPRDGQLLIGRAVYNGKPTDWFSGKIRGVGVFDTALTAGQIGDLAAESDPR